VIQKGEQIVTAYAERARGPGWSNNPIWVIVRDSGGNLREECLQPAELSLEMYHLYGVSEAAHHSMVEAVRRHVIAQPKEGS
jgi:hypothetical protein